MCGRLDRERRRVRDAGPRRHLLHLGQLLVGLAVEGKHDAREVFGPARLDLVCKPVLSTFFDIFFFWGGGRHPYNERVRGLACGREQYELHVVVCVDRQMGQPQERRRGQERLHHRAIEQDPYLVGRCREQRRRIPRDHDGLVAGLGGHVVPRRQPAVVFNRRFNLPRESRKQVSKIVLPWSIDSCTTRNLDSRLFRTQKNRAVQSQLQLNKANKPVPLVVLVVVRDMNTDRLALLDVWRQQRHGELNHPQILRRQRRHARHEAAYLNKGVERDKQRPVRVIVL